MHDGGFFFQAFVYLAAAVIAVPIAKRMGLGSVLGYLIAGILIGPFALGLVGDDQHNVMEFAEFGVAMMLFLIGLELEPKRVWRLRSLERFTHIYNNEPRSTWDHPFSPHRKVAETKRLRE